MPLKQCFVERATALIVLKINSIKVNFERWNSVCKADALHTKLCHLIIVLIHRAGSCVDLRN
uniref:Uncharacterized protein n=1 Tax=Megaselia scalaris TaxID=36166 RepID=T1GQR8_MEGSC